MLTIRISTEGALFRSGRTVPGEQEKKGWGGSETGRKKMTKVRMNALDSHVTV